MRRVIWIEDDGTKRVSLLRDNDPDHLAKAGLPVRMPADLIDFELVRRDLNNILIERGLFTLADLHRSKDGLRSAVLYALKRKLVDAYIEAEKERTE